jgi:hypothetical protein
MNALEMTLRMNRAPATFRKTVVLQPTGPVWQDITSPEWWQRDPADISIAMGGYPLWDGSGWGLITDVGSVWQVTYSMKVGALVPQTALLDRIAGVLSLHIRVTSDLLTSGVHRYANPSGWGGTSDTDSGPPLIMGAVLTPRDNGSWEDLSVLAAYPGALPPDYPGPFFRITKIEMLV